jgi:hypothetical protein
MLFLRAQIELHLCVYREIVYLKSKNALVKSVCCVKVHTVEILLNLPAVCKTFQRLDFVDHLTFQKSKFSTAF